MNNGLTEEKGTATSGNTAPATASDVYDQTFAFDLAYNRTSFEDVPPSSPFSYMFGPDNQNSNTAAFAYDGSGDPTQYNGSSSTYAYDPEQRLTGLGGFSAHYDGDGLRDYTIASGTTTYYLYDGSSPLLEETYSGSTTTLQVANGYADGWRERYAVTSFGFNAYGFDPQGSLNVEDSSFNTTLPCQNVYVYDGYGNRLVGERVSTGSTTAFNIDPVQFGGQYGYYTDVSTGEVQLTHRYYDASTGHFLNRDPIGYSGGQNLYAFCGNNPITNSDPEGTAAAAVLGVGLRILPNLAPAAGRIALGTVLAPLADAATIVGGIEATRELYIYGTTGHIAGPIVGQGAKWGDQLGTALYPTTNAAITISQANARFRTRPFAENATLNKNVIEELYRGEWVSGQWVSADAYPGGLAGAIRREKATGELVGGVSHLDKGKNRIANLSNILRTGKIGDEVLSEGDLEIVRSLRGDIERALQGK